MTTEQIRNQSKTVTRRYGWWFLKPGDRVCAVEKAMGLKKGEKVKPLALIEIVSCHAEMVHKITPEDCVKEGFPEFQPIDFFEMFRKHYGDIVSRQPVNRIEFKYVEARNANK